MEMLDEVGEISMSADILGWYREYAEKEVREGKEDFQTYSEWKEANAEVLA